MKFLLCLFMFSFFGVNPDSGVVDRKEPTFYFVVENGVAKMQRELKKNYVHSHGEIVESGSNRFAAVFVSDVPLPDTDYVPWDLLACISDALTVLDSGAGGSGGEFETVNYVIDRCGSL